MLLARALYRAPGALLLDEATSHLDVARERAVNETLQAMRLTRIVVAHRPQTILAAERVITLKDGRIAADERRGRTRTMSIRFKIIAYQAIVALMLIGTAAGTWISIERIDYYFDRSRLSRAQMDTVIRLSAHMNRYSENIAEMLLLGRTELDDFYAARSSLEDSLDRLTDLIEREIAFVRTDTERDDESEELVRARAMRDLSSRSTLPCSG